MSDSALRKKAADKGAPAWVMTFADLMSLLMCFFVLLLSFSEMDVAKYKQLAGSMKNAFGVQREIKVKEPPKGINVIAREFSPGRPEPTSLNVIRQMTTNDINVNLDLGKQRRRPVPTPRADNDPDREKSFKPQERASKQADRQDGQKAGQKADLDAGQKSGDSAQNMPGKRLGQADGLTPAQKKELAEAKKLAAARLDNRLKASGVAAGPGNDSGLSVDEKSIAAKLKAQADAERRRKLENSAKLISSALGKEIRNGSVDVETKGKNIIIRVREKASFGSGRAELKGSFRPLLAKVAKILQDSEGKIVVAGHTDNVPIYTERFRSNWELSSARAVSVAHEMLLASDIPSRRFLVQGFADTDPVAKNDSAANRARNRRVEIVLLQGDDVEAPAREIRGERTSSDGNRKSAQSAAATAASGVVKASPGGSRQPDTRPTVPSAAGNEVKQMPKAKAKTTAKSTATPPKASGIRVGGARKTTQKHNPDSQPESRPQPSPSGIRVGGQ